MGRSLGVFGQRKMKLASQWSRHVVSFILPAHDEDVLLPGTLQSIKAAMVGLDLSYEVVVVDDASTDRTSEVAASAGARVVRVNVRQISAARNAGARAAKGDILIFVDADTIISSDVVAAAVRSLSEGAVGGGCVIRFDGHVPWWIRTLEPLASVVRRIVRMAPGCFLFCTREAFMKVGGFDEGIFAAEDMVMSNRLKRVGRFVMLRQRVITSGRKPRTCSAWEFASALVRLTVLGPRGARDRRHLSLWYGPRRRDPELTSTGDLVKEFDVLEASMQTD